MAVSVALGTTIPSIRMQTPKGLESQDNLLGIGPINQLSSIQSGGEAIL